MTTTRLKRVARLIIATLPDGVIQKLFEKYINVPINTIKEIDSAIDRTSLPKKDTVTEWIVSQVAYGLLKWQEDLDNAVELADFFFTQSGTPKFRELALQTLDPANHSQFRNIFKYTATKLAAIKDKFFGSSDDPYERARLDKLLNLPSGAELVFNNNEVQIAKITNVGVACQMSLGSEWCTKKTDKSKEYLDSAPLYMIFVKGKKSAPLHFDETGKFQLKNLSNSSFPLRDPIRQALNDSGLLYKIAAASVKSGKSDSLLMIARGDPTFITKLGHAISRDPELSFYYAMNVVHGPWIEGEKAIASNPKLAQQYALMYYKGGWEWGEKAIATDAESSYYYAKNVLKGRFEKGEPAISTSSYFSYDYASQILNGRFPLGEPVLSRDPPYALLYVRYVLHDRFMRAEDAFVRSDYLHEYMVYLQRVGKLEEFKRDWAGRLPE